MTINEYFDKIICINLDRRNDRWGHAQDECSKHGIILERFAGFDMPGDGNRGCTESHGAVLNWIVANRWNRTLILEDDFEFRFDNSQEIFGEIIQQLPADWFMVYLGGHYGNWQNKLVSENIVRFNHMKTTTSYGVTLGAATQMAPHVHGAAPIDEVYYGWHTTKPCYVFTPRICVQYESYSDLQCRVVNHRMCMEDQLHENVLFGIATPLIETPNVTPMRRRHRVPGHDHDTVAY